MSCFENREKYNLNTAFMLFRYAERGTNVIWHLLDNLDGTFSIMTHINCEYCDYCEEDGAVEHFLGVSIHVPKKDPYENQKRI